MKQPKRSQSFASVQRNSRNEAISEGSVMVSDCLQLKVQDNAPQLIQTQILLYQKIQKEDIGHPLAP